MRRIRLSTIVLIVAFVAAWWVYDTYRVEPPATPAPQTVPPGFMPDPNFTWVPRDRQQQHPDTVTVTVTVAPQGGHSAPIPPPPAG